MEIFTSIVQIFICIVWMTFYFLPALTWWMHLYKTRKMLKKLGGASNFDVKSIF